MGVVLVSTKVYGGPGGAGIYAQVGTLDAFDSYTTIWDEYSYQYVEYPVTGGVKRGYIDGGANIMPSGYNLGVRGTMASNQTVWSTPAGNRINMGSVDSGENVSVLIRNSNGYAYVEYGSGSGTKRGWVTAGQLNLDGSTALAKMTKSANTYAGPNSYDSVVGSLAREEFVVVLSENNYCAVVEYCINSAPYRKQAYLRYSTYERLNTTASVGFIPAYDDDEGVSAAMLSSAVVYGGPDKTAYSQLGSVSLSEPIKVIFSEFDWFNISYGTGDGPKRGYVPMESVSGASTIVSQVPNKTDAHRGCGDYAIETATALTGPDASFVEAGAIGADEPITRFADTENGYVLVEYPTNWGAKRGYVPSSLLAGLNHGGLAYVSAGVNADVFFEPILWRNSGVIGVHEYVVVLSQGAGAEGFAASYFVEYNTNSGRKRGYVEKRFFTLLGDLSIPQHRAESQTVKASSIELTVYGGPGEKFANIGSIGIAEPVFELYTDGDFSCIEYTSGTYSKRGYVLSATLSENVFFINDFSHLAIPEQYGTSALGRPLIAYRLGEGPNHLVLNYTIHGWEDIWSFSGRDIERAGEATLTYLAEHIALLENWSVFVILASNPDGLLEGTTHNGPGRCSIKRYGATRGTLVDGGVDMNRSFQYKDASGNIRFDSVMNDSRNYTGPEANWCIESEALKSFIDSHKSETGINIFVDTHGYTNQILISQDTNQLYDFFHKQFTGGLYETIYHNGAGYVARYAHDFQGMDGCLFEFPANCTSEGALFTNGYHTLYINVIADILKNYPT